MILMSIEGMLGELGCDCVATAATVEQGLALVDARDFDAAILDMNLDGDTGSVVADALCARGTPFVFSTGYGEHGIPEAHRGRPVLRKPYQDRALAEALTRILPD